MQTYIKRYIRRSKEDQTPIGTVVAVKDQGKILYGYSLCNPRDKFDKKLGTAIALARATSPKESEPKVPYRREIVFEYLDMIEDKAHRYFNI